MSTERTLATVVCGTTLATVDLLMGDCGLQVRTGIEPNCFEIFSGGRAVLADPAVERELLTLAFGKLKEALAEGHLPAFSFIAPASVRSGLVM